MTLPFSPKPDGTVSMALGDGEAEFLRQIPLLLAGVGSSDGDPAAARLDITPYPDDPAAAEEYRRFMSEELDQSRAADRSAFAELVDAGEVTMSPAEAEAVLRVLAEGRLALAARLGVETEADYGALDEADAAALSFLAHLQVSLIEAISG